MRKTQTERFVFYGVLLSILGMFIWEIQRSGPLQISMPPTILSYSAPGNRGLAPYLVFLARIRQSLPPQSTVIVETAAGYGSFPSSDYLIAVGQLPDQRVLPPPEHKIQLGIPAGIQFIATYHVNISSPRLRLVADLPNGQLYKVSP